MASHPADLWQRDGDRVQCGLCPHACRIADGATGVCGVRRNEGGALVALTYGRVSSLAVDPIEKKPVYHYFPGASVLSLGSVGCTMRCGHCQNWSISRAGPDAETQEVSPETVVELAVRHGCGGVAFTYNEPVIWAEYVRDCGRACRERGLFTVMVTNGYVTLEGLDYLADAIDVWRVDVKGITDTAYRTLCKVPSPVPVLAAAARAKRHHHMHVEVVTNIVPGINDDEEDLRATARWIASSLGAETPWHVTRFFPYLEFSDLDPTPLATLLRASEIGHEEGLRFVYRGNVADRDGEDTTCPSCGATVIERDGYRVVADRSRDGACHRCGTSLGIVS